MSKKIKLPYVSPEAKLICFQAVEQIAALGDEDIGFEAMENLFNARTVSVSVSGYVTDPDFSLS